MGRSPKAAIVSAAIVVLGLAGAGVAYSQVSTPKPTATPKATAKPKAKATPTPTTKPAAPASPVVTQPHHTG